VGELTGQRERQTLLRVEHAVALTLAETTTASETYRNVLAAIGESLGWSIGAAWEHEPRPTAPSIASSSGRRRARMRPTSARSAGN